jgi:hypothetical protein
MLTRISPEGFDIANAWLQYGTIAETAHALQVTESSVVTALKEPTIKSYLDSVYLDMGYRNRNKLGALLDKIIDIKIQEAEDSEMWTSKDIIDLITLAHKMRMDEIKATATNNTTVNVANFNEGSNYGKLMEKLING